MRKATMLALAMIIAATCFAGWERTYGRSSYDIWGRSVAQTTDGGYIGTGFISLHDSLDESIYLMRTDSEGDTMWTRHYDGTPTDTMRLKWNRGYCVAQTSDGGFIVIGSTDCFGAEHIEVLFLRTDPYGNVIWARTYGRDYRDEGFSVLQTPDGGFIVAGYTLGSSTTPWSDGVYVVRTDSIGDTLWTRNYRLSRDDGGMDIVRTPDGGFVIAGYTETNVYYLKIDADGNLLWQRTYGRPYSYADGIGLANTRDNGFIICGRIAPVDTDIGEVSLIRTNQDGDTMWTQTHSIGVSCEGWSVVQASDGGFVVTGGTYSCFDTTIASGDSVDVFLLKTDPDGNLVWVRTFGDNYFDYGYSVFQTSDAGYVIAGTYGANRVSLGAEFYIIKTDSLGYTTIDEAPSARPENISIFAYPNPFNSEVTISFTCHSRENGNPEIEIFDVQGKMIMNRTLQGADNKIIWQPVQTISSGVYLVRARMEDCESTRKIVYSK